MSLLCHLFKVLEPIELNRILDPVDNILAPNQTGFRSVKSLSSTNFNLIQFTENGFEKNLVTDVTYVDLSVYTMNYN